MLLEGKHLQCGYGGKVVLEDFTLKCLPGTITAIVGPNGCGKSTLLRSLGRLLPLRCGVVELDKVPSGELSRREFARKLASLGQLHHTPPDMTAAELVTQGRYPQRRNLFGLTAADHRAVARALELTEVTHLAARQVRNLSGGERQRVFLAVALAQEPQVLLLDEPTTFLDVRCQFEIIEMLKRLRRELELTVITVLHDLSLAAACADQIVLMKAGKVVYSGTPLEVLTAEKLEEIFEVKFEILQRSDQKIYPLAVGKK